MRRIASRRAALDAEEARWLREAERCKIWRELGMVSALDYLERVLGYSPRTARERLRVARMLGDLPVLTNALAHGELSYSAVRELARVVTPSTEGAWCEAAIGKNLRQVEELITGHRRGDRPEDPVDPEVCTRVVRFELSAETFALLRQAQQILDEERGVRLSDDELIAALCGAVLDRGDASEPTGRAKFQIALSVCPRCQAGMQEGAGARVAVDASTIERARCDAQELGSVDGAEPERAHQDVPPSVVRLVWRRDGGRCRVPGCRSARSLEVHHLIHREHGGGHEPSNLILLCSACHAAHHRGKLRIRGTADHLVVERASDRAHVGARAADQLVMERAADRTHVRARAADQLMMARASDRAHVGAKAADQFAVVPASDRAHVGARAADQLAVERAADRTHVGARAADRLVMERASDRAHVSANGADQLAVERAADRTHVRANAADRLAVERAADRTHVAREPRTSS